MNNPLRALLQRYYEAPLLERLGGQLEAERVLEVGCGRGIGIEILFERFGAQSVYAFDLDPDMVRQAHHRLTANLPNQLMLTVSDVTAIPVRDEVFILGEANL